MNNSLRFYKNKLPFKERQFNLIFPLQPYFAELIGDKKEVRIADLGAGLFSTTGSTWENVKVTVYPSDILADEYGKLLASQNVVPVTRVLKEDMTALSYEDDFFDVVNCVNALDHCEAPALAIQEMYRVCKPDGYIYLRHFLDNAVYENYVGFHQWNMAKVVGNEDCVIWNSEDAFFLSDYVKNFKLYIRNDIDNRAMLVIIIHKEHK